MQLVFHVMRRTHHGASRPVIDCERGPSRPREGCEVNNLMTTAHNIVSAPLRNMRLVILAFTFLLLFSLSGSSLDLCHGL